jgi:hypothetical protein
MVSKQGLVHLSKQVERSAELVKKRGGHKYRTSDAKPLNQSDYDSELGNVEDSQSFDDRKVTNVLKMSRGK